LSAIEQALNASKLETSNYRWNLARTAALRY
jgi:hypothetical protein